MQPRLAGVGASPSLCLELRPLGLTTEEKRAARAPRTKVISALTARAQLGQILRRAVTKNERFVVTRRGQPQVVIMSMEDYVSTVPPPPQWLRSIWAASERRGTNRLTMRDITTEITFARREVRKKRATARVIRACE